jgi:hypothetical protein
MSESSRTPTERVSNWLAAFGDALSEVYHTA